MAINNDLPIKYSNTMYATKQDVMKDMKIPFIDNIWNKILEYRSNFQMVLTLRHITGTSYNVCLTPVISERVCSVERKMMRAMVNFSRLSNAGKRKFRDDSYVQILKTVAKIYKIQVEDDMLRTIVNGSASLIPPNMLILSRYAAALDEITLHYEQETDDNFLGHVYSALLGTSELLEFYRENDEGLPFSKTVVNKIYLGIPSTAITKSMDELLHFIKNSNVSVFIKASCALYYLYYVKPFESYSEDIAILLFKGILAHEDLESIGAFFNFENLLVNKEEFEKVFAESQQTFDLTYILNYILKYAESFLDNFLDRIIVAKRDDIATETYSPEPVSQPKPVEEPLPEHDVSGEMPNEIAITSAEFNAVNYNKEIAIRTLPAGLDEEEATMLETHLLELYPDLKRAQAYFYARHCTIGMTYTISQFQRATACAYETARTSMDNLVYLGFYRKELLKNKYVYTPVKRK